jgi:hypothetical protein
MQKIGSFDCFIPSLSKDGGVEEINLAVTLLVLKNVVSL